MKLLRGILKAMNFRGHIALRKKGFQTIDYVGGGTSESVIDRFGGYRVEYMEIVDGILVIYVN